MGRAKGKEKENREGKQVRKKKMRELRGGGGGKKEGNYKDR